MRLAWLNLVSACFFLRFQNDLFGIRVRLDRMIFLNLFFRDFFRFDPFLLSGLLSFCRRSFPFLRRLLIGR